MKKEYKIIISTFMEEEGALMFSDRLEEFVRDSKLVDNFSTVEMTTTDGKDIMDDAWEDDWPDVFPPVLTLDTDDLLVNDIDKGIIKVSKDIFDDFQENTIIDIKFVDDNSEAIHTYQMIDEDEEGITMRYFGTEPTPDTVVF
jgi:hypothetical protein